jgi:imidazolonepropionase
MDGFLVANARVLTLDGPGGGASRRGAAMRELGAIDRGFVAVRGGRIVATGAGEPPREFAGLPRIDAAGRVAMPAFVDCHTHLCHAGSRFDENDLRTAGVPYLEILKRGGGILASVRATRAAGVAELAEGVRKRLDDAARLGTATVEVKTGYGLDPASELRMLEAIRLAAAASASRVVPTFLGAHARDPGRPDAFDEIVREGLVAARAGGAAFADIYCEEGAFSPDETRRYLEAARAAGLPLRVHADQFHALGGVELALALGARTVDHLEASRPETLAAVAASDATAVLLPGCGFHLDGRYADGRKLVDLGAAVAIATNMNPGSSPTLSMPFTIALAVKHAGLMPSEAIVAATVNAAAALGLGHETGRIAPGLAADLQLLDACDERSLAYEYGGPGPIEVWRRGVPLAPHR